MSQELSEAILTMVPNAALIINKARQAAPGVVGPGPKAMPTIPPPSSNPVSQLACRLVRYTCACKVLYTLTIYDMDHGLNKHLGVMLSIYFTLEHRPFIDIKDIHFQVNFDETCFFKK